MDLKEVFGSARAEHEPDYPTSAARPILMVEDDSTIGMKAVSREPSFEMFETDDPRVRQFALEAACPRS